MHILTNWIDKVYDNNKEEQCIYCMCFKPDKELVIGAGSKIFIYQANNGVLIKTLNHHKGNVISLCYCLTGNRLASGATDKSVIIWSSEFEEIFKYLHCESLQCMNFNPVSIHLASCSSIDFGFWSGENKSIQKYKCSDRILCCAWTTDGEYLTLGFSNGFISVRKKNGEEKLGIERSGGNTSGVVSLKWKSCKSKIYEFLAVVDLNQNLSFYSTDGKQILKEISIGFDPCFINFFCNEQYILLGGSNCACHLYSCDGVQLIVFARQASWIRCCAVDHFSNFLAVGCQDGTLACYHAVFEIVHSLYKDQYVYREGLTNVIVQHLLNNKQMHLRCHEIVKKVSIYNHLLALQLPSQITVYTLDWNQEEKWFFHLHQRICKQFDCSSLVICSNNIILCKSDELISLYFDGSKHMEWKLESSICYIKIIGVVFGNEILLLGLRNGQVLKVFLDNAFPIMLLQAPSAVCFIDLSPMQQKLAVVDENNICYVYKLESCGLLFQESQVYSAAWNLQHEDLLSFSGNDSLCIKARNFPVHKQQIKGFVLLFSGSRLYCLQNGNMISVEVLLSSIMYQYLDSNMHRSAFEIACLGVKHNDWKQLAIQCLHSMNLDISKKAFTRIHWFPFIDLIHEFESCETRTNKDEQIFRAKAYAYLGDFKKAAHIYAECDESQSAIEMYSSLHMFDAAEKLINAVDFPNKNNILKKNALIAINNGKPYAAIMMYLNAEEWMSAIQLAGKNNWIDVLLDISWKLKDTNKMELLACAHYLRHSHMQLALDIYERLHDIESEANLYIEKNLWEKALSLVQQYPKLKSKIYLPYANWLAENGKFIEAQNAFINAGYTELASNILLELIKNAINEFRFKDAAYYYWIMSYHPAQNVEPFFMMLPESLLNIAKFLYLELKQNTYEGVSKFAILYTLAKQSIFVGTYKTAKQILQEIQHLYVPPHYQDTVNLDLLLIRENPSIDKTLIDSFCYNCSKVNTFLDLQYHYCLHCHNPFVYSFISFEILPLVQLNLEQDISNDEALNLIKSDCSIQLKNSQQNISKYASLHNTSLPPNSTKVDGFASPVLNREQLKFLNPAEIFITNCTFPDDYHYYKNMIPEVSITQCASCYKFFLSEDYDLQILQYGKCAYCRSEK